MLRKPIPCFVFLSALLICFASYDVESKTGFSWPTIRSEQIPNFTGTYTAPHRGGIYNVIIQTMGTEPQNQRFIIAGFFEKRRQNFVTAMARIISKDRESINAEICKIATENYCREYPDLSLSDCFRKTASRTIRHYQEQMRQTGIMLNFSATGKTAGMPAGFPYDKFEILKGNILLPEKEYRVSNLSLNQQQELSSISFRETGFIPGNFLTSETLSFTKQSNKGLAQLETYLRKVADIYRSIRQAPQSICK